MRQEKKSNRRHILVTILAILGLIAAIAGIAYAVYRFLTPDYMDDDEDLDDDFDEDDLNDDDFDDDDYTVISRPLGNGFDEDDFPYDEDVSHEKDNIAMRLAEKAEELAAAGQE